MNQLHLGISKKHLTAQRPFLHIDDDPPDLAGAKYFDPHRRSFNPLADITPRKARDLAALFYSLSPEGANTLTVRNGRRALAPMLLKASRLDSLEASTDAEAEAKALVEDVLFSPLLKRILCGKPNFDFSPTKTIIARIDRAELGRFDGFVLGNLLIQQFKGQIVLDDFGFYALPLHVALIDENRLICGLHFLDELPTALRTHVLLIRDKIGAGCTYPDAQTLAIYAGLTPTTTGYTDFVQRAME